MDKTGKDKQNVQININSDTTPIFYTDNIYITTNEDGVVLDIAQKLGTTNKVVIVSRIGMSRTHAQKLVKELAKTIAISENTDKVPTN